MSTSHRVPTARRVRLPERGSAGRARKRVRREDSTSVGAILRTKLHPPALESKLVMRPRLLDKLNESPRRALTLISAPAGYGKSTLVAQWLDAHKAPSAWLSLGVEDSDLRTFLRYLVAAVRKVSPQACTGSVRLVEAIELPPASLIVDTLSNDLEALGTPFILVLDDYYHVCGGDVHALLEELLRFPPRPLHLVIATRHDPPFSLASLRARKGLVEIRQEELRFSGEETKAVVKKDADIELTEASLTRVDEEMEGWVVGLHLLCLALHHQPQPEAFLAQLRGGDHNINDYLVEQVLEKQAPELRECLVRISILDRFCAPLVEALCDPATVQGATVIRTLTRTNLFVIPLDAQGEWFRFHHLFRHLLQQQLGQRCKPQERAALHLRASQWFAENTLVDESIDHALAADDPIAAARLVEAQRLPALEADCWPDLERWLAKLPEQVKRERFELLLAEAWMAQQHYRLSELPNIVELAEEVRANQPVAPHLLGELAFFWSYIWFWRGDGPRSQTFVEQGLQLIPEDVSGMVRSHIELQVGLTGYIQGQKEAAIRQLTEWIERRPLRSGIVWERVIFGRSVLWLLAADLPRARQDAQSLSRNGDRTGKAFIQAWGSYLTGVVAFHSLDLTEARHQFRRVVERRYAAHTRPAVGAFVELALTCQLLGDADQADRVLAEAQEFAEWTENPSMIEVVRSGRARVALLRDDLDSASRWQRSFRGAWNVPAMILFPEQPAITECRVLIAAGTESGLREALNKLLSLECATSQLHYDGQTLEILALKALALQKQKHEPQALQTLQEALAMADSGSWVRPFVELGRPMADLLERLRSHKRRDEQMDRILAAFPEGGKPAVPKPADSSPQSAPLINSLTHRELDTLELLAQRLYDKEIAERLSVSIWTIKSHLKHIFRKLQVDNRRQAILKAQQLGLLPYPHFSPQE